MSFRQRELGLYWQDVWKVRANLTFTYGLRWEYYGVPYETHNTISTLLTDPSSPASSFTFVPVGRSGVQLYKNDYKDFEPRFGFAWDPFKSGRTSVRGGIGFFNDRVYGNLSSDVRGNPPFQPSCASFPLFSFSTCSETNTGVQVSQQVAFGPASFNPVIPNGAGIFPEIFDQNLKGARSVNWNLGVERELVRNLTVEANYVGTHATRVLRVVDGNPPQESTLVAQLLAFCVPGNPANMGFNTQSGQCDASTLTFGNLYFGFENGVLPFDAVNNNAFFNTFTVKSIGRSFYDGLQLQVSERNFHGLQVSGAYTWSHAIDDSSDPLVQTGGNRGFPRDSFHLNREKGNSGFDTRQRAVVNFIYQPNIGRGRAHLSSGFAGRLLEGWAFNGIATWQSGLPYDIFGTADTLHTSFSDRATIIGSLQNPPGTDKRHTGPPVSAFNPDNAKVMPIPFGIPANIGRNAFYGPGINNWDMSLIKDNAITERFKLQMRFECFNVFNRAHFGKPDNVVGDSTFGVSTSQVGQNDGTTGARQIQFGLKLNF